MPSKSHVLDKPSRHQPARTYRLRVSLTERVGSSPYSIPRADDRPELALARIEYDLIISTSFSVLLGLEQYRCRNRENGGASHEQKVAVHGEQHFLLLASIGQLQRPTQSRRSLGHFGAARIVRRMHGRRVATARRKIIVRGLLAVNPQSCFLYCLEQLLRRERF